MSALEAYVLECYRAPTPSLPDYTIVAALTGETAIEAEKIVLAICRKWSRRRVAVEERAA